MKKINMKKHLLTRAHERSLQSSLFLFEKALRKVDRLISEDNEVGILYFQKSQLDSQMRELIHKKIVATLRELELLVNNLGLKPFEENVENTIMAEMSICWENLEEIRSKRMKGYEELDPQAAELIDSAIDHFANIALELSSMSVLAPPIEITEY
jgi:hypothetical protein